MVCCFGYLGFRNFIFSRMECKESVMLFGRDLLTKTKELAEKYGLETLYGITDCVFLSNGNPEKYAEFCASASKETGLELLIDRHFKAVMFPKSADGSGAANKYFGLTYGNEIEARGIHLRHSDAPRLLKNFQEQAIREMFCLEGREDMKSAAEKKF